MSSDTRRMNRWRESEQNPRQYGNAEGEEQHAKVWGWAQVDVCVTTADKCNQRARCGKRDPKSHQPANDRQQERFYQALPHDAHSARPEREAREDFVATRRRAREKEIGQVRASDQQHQSDNNHQDSERFSVLAADQRHAMRSTNEGNIDSADLQLAIS